MNKTCTVKNKSAGSVFYSTPRYGRKVFHPGQSIPNIEVAELKELVQQPGGMALFYNFLQVDDKTIVQEILNAEMPLEYWFKEEEISGWMNSCSLAEFQDALDFAPEGTKELIKKFAVEQKLNDYNKREAIKEQLGFDVSKAIEAAEVETAQAAKPAARRAGSTEASPEVAETKPQRRVTIQ